MRGGRAASLLRKKKGPGVAGGEGERASRSEAGLQAGCRLRGAGARPSGEDCPGSGPFSGAKSGIAEVSRGAAGSGPG